MTVVAIRNAEQTDLEAVVALNLAEVRHTSPMDAARLRCLDDIACYHKVATVDGIAVAFLLAMRSGCGYINDNFAWFAARYQTFLYVDRIVVGRRHQGLALGTLLYQDLFDYARSHGIATIACEYNLIPSNEPSQRFHDRFGFHEVARRWAGGGSKQVSLQVADT